LVGFEGFWINFRHHLPGKTRQKQALCSIFSLQIPLLSNPFRNVDQ
jgi:hypothetical protein